MGAKFASGRNLIKRGACYGITLAALVIGGCATQLGQSRSSIENAPMVALVEAGNPDSAFDVAMMAAMVMMVSEANPTAASKMLVVAKADRALALDPRSASMSLLRGAYSIALGKWEIGVKDLNRATELAPAVPKRHFSTAEIRQNSSVYKVFQGWLAQATAARFPGRFINPDSLVDPGIGLLGHGPSFSTPDWTRVIERNPESSIAFFMRAFGALKAGRTDQGLYDIERYLRLSAISIERFLALVMPWAQHELNADPRLPSLLLAVAQSAKDLDQAAIQTLTTLLEKYPDYAAARSELAWILATSSDPLIRDGSRAVELAEQAAAREPSARNLRVLAAAYAEMKDFQRAVDIQQEAVARTKSEGGAREDYNVYLLAYRIGYPWRKNQ